MGGKSVIKARIGNTYALLPQNEQQRSKSRPDILKPHKFTCYLELENINDK
eukprot:Pgem_evm1s8887